MESTAVGRVSDDFYPTDAASWSSHLGICAYNSLFMAPLVQVPPTARPPAPLYNPTIQPLAMLQLHDVAWPTRHRADTSASESCCVVMPAFTTEFSCLWYLYVHEEPG